MKLTRTEKLAVAGMIISIACYIIASTGIVWLFHEGNKHGLKYVIERIWNGDSK